MNKNLYVVILAGGSGTRFWPLSREEKPKQFLNMLGERTLFEDAIHRMRSKAAPSRVLVVTNKSYLKPVEGLLKKHGIPKSNILFEPQGKNTAAAICWAAAWIHQKNKNATMVVLPSDHLILNEKDFLKSIDRAVHLAQKNYLVTLGIAPARPETGYGYIQTKKVKQDGEEILKAVKFLEKPSLSKAQTIFKNKVYFWNSGMFIWKASVILEEFKKFLPAMSKEFSKRKNLKDVESFWARLPSISIDYGILEKAGRIVTVAANNIGWSDLGSWEALIDALPKDNQGHVLKGDVVHLNCENISIFGEKRLIVPVGLKDLVIVDTPDALLICRKDLSQKVKDIVSILKAKKHKTVF